MKISLENTPASDHDSGSSESALLPKIMFFTMQTAMGSILPLGALSLQEPTIFKL